MNYWLLLGHILSGLGVWAYVVWEDDEITLKDLFGLILCMLFGYGMILRCLFFASDNIVVWRRR